MNVKKILYFDRNAMALSGKSFFRCCATSCALISWEQVFQMSEMRRSLRQHPTIVYTVTDIKEEIKPKIRRISKNTIEDKYYDIERVNVHCRGYDSEYDECKDFEDKKCKVVKVERYQDPQKETLSERYNVF